MCASFEKATAIIERNREWTMQPVGVAVEIPATFKDVARDSIWLLLFVGRFRLLSETHPAAMSIEFVFDQNQKIDGHAQKLHRAALDALAVTAPGRFLEGLTFTPDHDAPQVQAADFLMYEWRRRISKAHRFPEEPERPWFPRMRAARPGGALWRYGREVFEQALRADDQSASWARAVMSGEPSHRD